MEKISVPKIIPVVDIPMGNSVPIDNLISLFRTCIQLEKVCTENQGIGLSAVQVGIPWNLFVVLHSDHYKYLLNCEYEGFGDKNKSIEGCLSLRDAAGVLRRFEVERYKNIKVKGQELLITDKPVIVDFEKELDGLYAVVYAHEIDHQFGRERMVDVIGTEIDFF